MGTRNLTVVISNKEVKVAQYAQWDGYPSGQGATIVRFITTHLNGYSRNTSAFVRKLQNTRFISDEEITARWEERGAKDGMADMAASERFQARWMTLSRDCGADVLNYIHYRGGDVELSNQFEFAKDSVFCEWAYVLDLDNEILEVYKGFNQEPLTPEDRFYFNGEVHERSSDYYPVKLLCEFRFKDLRSVEDFVKACEEADPDYEGDDE